LTGLVYATALVRPSRSVLDLTPKSVKKKWKQASFAAGVNREVIERFPRSMYAALAREELVYLLYRGQSAAKAGI